MFILIFFVFFVAFSGSALSQCGNTMKKIGNSEKDFMQKSMSHFLHPLKSFLDNEMKTITVRPVFLFNSVKDRQLEACFHVAQNIFKSI